MSFKAKLKVGGNEYNILKCFYGLHQETDATGRPSSITRGGMITVIVESTNNTFLSDWMFSSFELKNGSIVFYKRDTEATAKELFFNDAYAVKYTENFKSYGRSPMRERLTISARELFIGNGIHVNEWV